MKAASASVFVLTAVERRVSGGAAPGSFLGAEFRGAEAAGVILHWGSACPENPRFTAPSEATRNKLQLMLPILSQR